MQFESRKKMEKGWVKIFSTTKIHQIEIVKGILKDREIDAVSINKRDSAYPFFGEIELFVKNDNVLRALDLINKNEL